MINANSEKSLLRDDFPSNCNTQQPTPCGTPSNATTNHPNSLKAAAMLVLERTREGNNHATTTEKGTQQPNLNIGLEIVEYTQADLEELDSLIHQVCDLCGHSDEVRHRMIDARMTMQPRFVIREINYFRNEVNNLLEHKGGF